MLVSLISIQAHSFVPHHHHSDEGPLRCHAADHGTSSDHAAHEAGAVDCRQDVAGHEEPSLNDVSRPKWPGFDLVVAIPPPIEVVLQPHTAVRHRKIISAEHPYATGPPGTTSSRAPPASLTA
jgi:hypothetical protein